MNPNSTVVPKHDTDVDLNCLFYFPSPSFWNEQTAGLIGTAMGGKREYKPKAGRSLLSGFA